MGVYVCVVGILSNSMTAPNFVSVTCCIAVLFLESLCISVLLCLRGLHSNNCWSLNLCS